MDRSHQPPRLPAGQGKPSAWRRDRLGVASRGARELGAVWQLERNVYMAAAAGPCEAVLKGTTREYDSYPGTFPPSKRPDGSGPAPGERAHVQAARRHGLRPKALATRLGDLGPAAYEFAADWPTDTDVAVLPRAQHALAVIGSRYLFSTDADTFVTAGIHLVEARADIVNALPLPRWLPTPAHRLRARRQAEFAAALQPVIDRRRVTGRLGDDVLGHLLRPSPRYGLLPDAAVIDDLAVTLVGAIEPTTRAVGWTLLALARHPDAADRVAAEADSLPEDPRSVTAAQLDGLRYTQAFVREVLRLNPPNWLLARRATQQTELDGYPVAPDTMVLVCPYTANRDPTQHPEPERFRPERWLDADGDLTVPGSFLSFGTGPHACAGTAMALAELTLITARTAHHYRLGEPPGPAPSHRVTTLGALIPTDLRLRATTRA